MICARPYATYTLIPEDADLHLDSMRSAQDAEDSGQSQLLMYEL